MSNTSLFIELTDSVKPDIPLCRGKTNEEYCKELCNYYNISTNTFNLESIKIDETIKGKIKNLLKKNCADFLSYIDLKNILKQIIWEHIVFSNDLEPYFGILSFLWDISRGIYYMLPLTCRYEWETILKLIKEYYVYKNWTSENQPYKYKIESRAIAIGTVLKYFLDKYKIKINFEDGHISLAKECEIIIYKEIESIVKYIGGINIISCLLFINKKKYNTNQHRFLFVRNISDNDNIGPDLPIGYLINISLKYLKNNIEIQYEKIDESMKKLFKLAKNYCALYDTQSYNQWEDLIIPHETLPRKLHELSLYDTLFTINQFNPYSIRNFLRFIFSFHKLKFIGFDINCYIDFVSDIIEKCADIFQPCILKKKEFYKKYNRLLPSTIDMIFDTFSYDYYKINSNYKYPDEYMECNAMLKPFVNIGSGKYLLINSSICAMNAYEALASRLRDTVKNLDDRIGEQFEAYVKYLFNQKGILFHSAKYKNGSGQCDVIVETDEKIIFIEIKKKSLTRLAKSGNDVKIFFDLSKSLVESLIQLNRHEIILYNLKKLELEDYTLYLNERGVEKMTLVLHDYGVMQSNMICDQILKNLEIGGYEVYDLKYKQEFDGISDKFKKLNQQITQLNIWKNSTQQPHFNYKFLSLSQLLIILDESSSNETFVKNLMKIKYVALYNHDFYYLYEYVNKLEETYNEK